jgi:hypothetical protein
VLLLSPSQINRFIFFLIKKQQVNISQLLYDNFYFLTFGKQQAIAKYTASKKKVYDLVLVNISPVS